MTRCASVVALLLCAACPRPSNDAPDAGVPRQCEGDAAPCTESSDCPWNGSPTRPFCDLGDPVDGVGCCRPGDLCLSDDDCVAGAVCDVRRGLCELDDPCLTDTVCGDPQQVCLMDDDFSSCQSPPPPEECVVVTPGPVESGASVVLEVLGLSASGALTTAFHAPTWSASAGVLDGNVLATACAGAAVCATRVTATVASATCEGELRVFPPAGADTARVVVVDAGTRAPLGDVRIDARVDGTFVTLATDADGSATVEGDIDVISAFPSEHAWRTALSPGRFTVFAVEHTGSAARSRSRTSARRSPTPIARSASSSATSRPSSRASRPTSSRCRCSPPVQCRSAATTGASTSTRGPSRSAKQLRARGCATSASSSSVITPSTTSSSSPSRAFPAAASSRSASA